MNKDTFWFCISTGVGIILTLISAIPAIQESPVYMIGLFVGIGIIITSVYCLGQEHTRQAACASVLQFYKRQARNRKDYV